MKCQICKDDVKGLDEKHDAHLVIHRGADDGHVHVHGDITKKSVAKELLEVAAREIGVSTGPAANLPKEIVFHNRQRIGDMLMFTCAVRDFKAQFPGVRINVIAIAMHIFDHNPNIDPTLIGTTENIVKIGPGRLTNASNRLDWHFSNAYRWSMEDALKVNIQQGESRPDIYLTQEEYDAPRLWERPYWVICITGEKGWGCKMYPFEKWQRLVDQFPDMLFVQIGTKEDNPPRLQGKNVVDYVGQTQSKDTGIRDLFKLFLNAEGSIGLVSFHMHLSGALQKPCIVVAGAREPVSFTRYAGHQYIATDGCLPCAKTACWHCSIDACTNLVHYPDKLETKVPKCVDMIQPHDVCRAFQNYYVGGRLDMNKPADKPKLKNIVPTPVKKVEIPKVEIAQVNTHGMSWGGGSLTDRDWSFIKGTIDKYGVKRVLEFGAGLSTLLLNDVCESVVTYETKQGWIDKIKTLNPKANIFLWDGGAQARENIESGKLGDGIAMEKGAPLFDLAFVDGPAGDFGRGDSTKIAARQAKIVIVHDAGREWARKYQDEYLKPGFEGPVKGGHRCHLWIKKGVENASKISQGGLRQEETSKVSTLAISDEIVESIAQCEQIQGITEGGAECYLGAAIARKSVRIVSTARGWGGCARSVTTIMRMLLAAGHKVEFVPFRNVVSSREFGEALQSNLKNVQVKTTYEALKQGCDVLLVYADDFVWEFGSPEMVEAFSEVKADRKIMMLNYRRGKVGELEWTRNWDKYMFLNSTQERELLKVHPGVTTKVLPPCTDLTEFFKVEPDYENGLRVVRHSSQGDTKFDKAEGYSIEKALEQRDDLEFSFLPGASWMVEGPRLHKAPRTASPIDIARFLSRGNLFWYSLPPGYMDMGPRVILEAMACGLPILADNWGGAVDRVTPECGWLCDTKEEQRMLMRCATPTILEDKGQAARARAWDEFRPEKWIEELVG